MDYLIRVDSHGYMARVSYNLTAKLRHAASNISFLKKQRCTRNHKNKKDKQVAGYKDNIADQRRVTFATSFPGSLFSASIVVLNDNGGREERPWEQGCHFCRW